MLARLCLCSLSLFRCCPLASHQEVKKSLQEYRAHVLEHHRATDLAKAQHTSTSILALKLRIAGANYQQYVKLRTEASTLIATTTQLHKTWTQQELRNTERLWAEGASAASKGNVHKVVRPYVGRPFFQSGSCIDMWASSELRALPRKSARNLPAVPRRTLSAQVLLLDRLCWLSWLCHKATFCQLKI